MKAYFINSKKEICGVYQYGKRLWDVVQYSKLNITYHEVENLNDFNSLDFSDIDVLFFNWIEGGLAGPFGWFNHDVVKKLKENYSEIKTITVMHTPDLNTVTFDYCINQNPLKDGLTRPLYDFDINKPKKQYSIPHIGSFGFASEHKGFDDIVRLVNEQYDEAQINLHITKAHYGDEDGSRQNRVINQIKEISLKPKIKLNITTDFIGNEELLEFTHNNDIIVLAYKSGKDPSSLPDYPTSTNTPIAITSIGMFSHIYNENLDINLKTIPEILEYNKKTNYVSELRNKWSREILCEEFENLINMI